jgi:hypothetical protein
MRNGRLLLMMIIFPKTVNKPEMQYLSAIRGTSFAPGPIRASN